MSVRIKGRENFKRAEVEMRKALEQALKLSALKIKTEAQRIFKPLNKPYPRRTPDAGVPHVRTGMLRGSIMALPAGVLSYIVGTNVKYGPMLEWGTTRMRARPFLLPGLLKSRMFIEQVFKRLGYNAVIKVKLR